LIVLGIATSTDQVGCALGGQEGILASFQAGRGRRHAEILTPAIQFIAEQAGIELNEVRAIAVDVGPGLFTGLRVGIATAKAMAFALRVPMVGLPSLDLLAYPFRHSSRVIVPVIDAKRGEVFASTYRRVPGGLQRMSEYAVLPPEELANDLEATAEECLVVGDGAARYAEAFADNDRVEVATAGTAFPSAAALVELAHPKVLHEDFVQPSEIEPLYLRRADAQINWSSRQPVGWEDKAESA
jgi:tRNA threonylcarbamoyladenosine biosynthesis protein TsaB